MENPCNDHKFYWTQYFWNSRFAGLLFICSVWFQRERLKPLSGRGQKPKTSAESTAAWKRSQMEWAPARILNKHCVILGRFGYFIYELTNLAEFIVSVQKQYYTQFTNYQHACWLFNFRSRIYMPMNPLLDTFVKFPMEPIFETNLYWWGGLKADLTWYKTHRISGQISKWMHFAASISLIGRLK